MSVHNIVGRMPVAVKARDEPGVIIAGGGPKDLNLRERSPGQRLRGEPVKKDMRRLRRLCRHPHVRLRHLRYAGGQQWPPSA